MHEKCTSKRVALIEAIIDRRADNDLGARAAMRATLSTKTFSELQRMLDDTKETSK